MGYSVAEMATLRASMGWGAPKSCDSGYIRCASQAHALFVKWTTQAKDIILKPIAASDANRIIKGIHHSGKVVRNSQLHFGVFLDGKCGGALQFGPSLDKRKICGLVTDTKMAEFLELNRMALADWLPRNSESRSTSVSLRLIRKHYPHIKWVVSFADGTQCGHGVIYQSSNFVLTGITKSKNLARLPAGSVVHKMTLESSPTSPRTELGGRSYFDITGGRYSFSSYVDAVGAEVLEGFQFRYMYFLDPTARQRLTVPVIPFSKIKEIGGEMVRGEANRDYDLFCSPFDLA